MSWNDFIIAAKQGKLPDVEFTKVADKKASEQKPVNPLGIFSQAAKQAAETQTKIQSIETAKRADEWFQKLSFIDASQMGGGGGMPPMPPGGDPMMGGGGMPPMPPGGDPMMGGGGMPPMDPSMMGGGGMPMDPAMMGGMPPGGAPPMPPMDPAMGAPPMDPAMGGAPPTQETQKKEKIDVLLARETSRLKELIYGLYSALSIPIPPSAVDQQELAKSIIDQQERAKKEQMTQDSINPQNPRINAIEPLLSGANKIGSVLDTLNDNSEKLASISRFLNK